MANQNTGTLIVQATSAREAIPLANVTVVVRQIHENLIQRIISILHTDTDGLTEPLSVETPSPQESLAPGGKKPFTELSLEISADGYYSIVDTHVPIYPGVTSLQPARMIPLPESEYGNRYPSGNLIVNDETGTPQL